MERIRPEVKDGVSSGVPVIIAADNQKFRDRLVNELAAVGVTPVIIGNSTMAWKAPPKTVDEGLLVLETDDDVARLVQIVNDLDRSPFHIDGAQGTICVVSQDAAERNQSLFWWLVDGHAAVLHVWLRETAVGGAFAAMARRMASWQKSFASNADEGPRQLDALFEAIRTKPDDPDRWLAAYDLVMGYNGIHTVRNYVGAALALQAVRLRDGDATAWWKLTKALYDQSRHEEVVEYCREALSRHPEFAVVHLLMAESLNRLGRRDEEIVELRKAIELSGDDTETREIAQSQLSSRLDGF